MADKILINNLSFLANIGVNDWEKTFQQKLEVDLEVSFDLAKAAKSDDLADTLDYFALSQAVLQLANSRHFHLIEQLAEEIAQLLLGYAGVKKAKVYLRKPSAVPAASSVGVKISRKVKKDK